MNHKRNQLLDITKGIAIIMVILGHAIQQYSGLDSRSALNLGIERFILSFHMPLFMLVSGYLFSFSLKRHSEGEIIKKRIKMFLFPILTVAVIRHFRRNISHLEFSSFVTGFPSSLFDSLWFFWSIIIITLSVCMVHKWLKDNVIGYMFIIFVTLLLPDVYPLRAYVHLVPVFLLGYAYASIEKYIERGGQLLGFQLVLFIIMLYIYILMFPHFGNDEMIYFSRYSLVGSIDIVGDILRDLFRFFIGVVGSLMMLLALNILIRLNILSGRMFSFLTTIGGMTFGLYVFQDLLLMFLSPMAKFLNRDYYILNALISFVFIFLMAIYMTRIAGNNKWSSLLFLGKVERNQ